MSASDHLGIQFHSTRSAEFPASDWVHVGTRTAAVNRAKDWSQELQRRGEPDSPVHLHQVEISGSHYPNERTDNEANDPVWQNIAHSHGHTVIPYTNEYEDPGTTSYMVHKSAIRSLGSSMLSEDESHGDPVFRA